MLALAEKQMLIQAVGQFVIEEVATAVAPLLRRLDNIENGVCPDILATMRDVKELRESVAQQFAQLPVPKDGKDGAPGKDADLDAVAQMIGEANTGVRVYFEQAIAALPKPERGEKGDKGDPGAPGKDGKDGLNGRDGVDGKSISLDDIRACLADLVSEALARIPVPRNCVGGYIDRRGHLFLRFSDGSDSDLGEVAGKDGKDCDIELVRSQVAAFLATIEKPKDGKDGRDGVGFDDLQLDFDGERDVVLKFIRGEVAKVFNLHFPVPISKGVWREGAYERGDMVQRDGSTWIAERDTKGQPGLPDSGWKLSTKRGRDGKDGKDGKPGPEGPPGKAGRDLTQMGLDGSKW